MLISSNRRSNRWPNPSRQMTFLLNLDIWVLTLVISIGLTLISNAAKSNNIRWKEQNWALEPWIKPTFVSKCPLKDPSGMGIKAWKRLQSQRFIGWKVIYLLAVQSWRFLMALKELLNPCFARYYWFCNSYFGTVFWAMKLPITKCKG